METLGEGTYHLKNCTIEQMWSAMDTETLGDAVRARRRALGLHQEELADLAGVSTRFVHTLENDKPSVRLDKVHAVLAVLGLRLRVDGPAT